MKNNKETKEKILEALEGKSIIVDDVQDGDVIKYYYVDLDVDGDKVSVSIEETEFNNPQITELTSIEFNEGSEKLTEERKEEVKDWLFQNSETWRGN